MLNIQIENKSKEIQFPSLVEGTSGLIVLAEKATLPGMFAGTILAGNRSIGKYLEVWLVESFTPFDSSITISNK